MISLLTSNKITPIAVFDGRRFKAKSNAESSRRINKHKNLELANKSIEDGNDELAKKYFKQSLRITTKMINTLIDLLKKLKIRVIIAPYEADAQLAHLYTSGVADFVISEDSDLLLFGAQKIYYKLNQDGVGEFYDYKKFKNTPIEAILIT